MKVVRWAFRVGSWQPSELDWLRISSSIQAEEKERIGRFVFKRDAKSSMAGRLMIRKFIKEVTNLSYSEIRLGRDERGKPFLANAGQPVILFNVSHQGDFAVLAGVQGLTDTSHRIGTDVMKVEYSGGKSQEEFFRIMARNFSSKEWSTIRSFETETERLTSFCRHWSLKESYVKATGTGITVNLQDLSFSPHSAISFSPVCDTKLEFKNVLQLDWIFEESLLDNQHCVSVARNFDCDVDEFKLLTFKDISDCCEPILPEDIEYFKEFMKKDEKPC